MPVVFSEDGDPVAAAAGGSKLGPMVAVVLVVLAAGLVGWRVRQAKQEAVKLAALENPPPPGPGGPGGGPQAGQGGGPGGGPRQSYFERMGEQLALTDDQKAQAAKLQEEFSPQMAALREDASLTDEQRREKFRDLAGQQAEAFRKILTPEQQKKLDELAVQREQAGPGGPGGQGGPGGPGGPGGRQGWMTRLVEQLELTDEQKPKWDKIRSAYDAKRQALRDDTALSDEDRRAKMGELRTQQNEELKTILTPEQQKKMAELQAERARNFGGGQGGPGGGQGGPGGGPGGPGGEGGRGGRGDGPRGEGGGAAPEGQAGGQT